MESRGTVTEDGGVAARNGRVGACHYQNDPPRQIAGLESLLPLLQSGALLIQVPRVPQGLHPGLSPLTPFGVYVRSLFAAFSIRSRVPPLTSHGDSPLALPAMTALPAFPAISAFPAMSAMSALSVALPFVAAAC